MLVWDNCTFYVVCASFSWIPGIPADCLCGVSGLCPTFRFLVLQSVSRVLLLCYRRTRSKVLRLKVVVVSCVYTSFEKVEFQSLRQQLCFTADKSVVLDGLTGFIRRCGNNLFPSNRVNVFWSPSSQNRYSASPIPYTSFLMFSTGVRGFIGLAFSDTFHGGVHLDLTGVSVVFPVWEVVFFNFPLFRCFGSYVYLKIKGWERIN